MKSSTFYSFVTLIRSLFIYFCIATLFCQEYGNRNNDPKTSRLELNTTAYNLIIFIN